MSDWTPKGYNTPIPAKIMTPDTVETRLGTLNFFDGLPTSETVDKLYEHLDFLRGIEVFLNFIPAASAEALRFGLESIGVRGSHQAVIFDQLMDSNPLFLTGNTDTVYYVAALDLDRDGPTVVEIPPGCGPGTVDDAFFRFVVDMGRPGPDRGEAGKYLIVPADYDDDIPDGYFTARSPSSANLLILRGFLVDGKPDASVKLFTEGVRVYPLADKDNPRAMELTNGSTVAFNTIHANNIKFYEEVAAVVEREPSGCFDPELLGLAAAIGIRKGQPFAPDDRMQAILTDAVAVANATARAIVFKTRDPAAYLYPDSRWQTGFVGGDYRWLRGDGEAGRDLDARTLYFYFATVNTPAMALEMPGVGSQYAYTAHDSDGTYLDGGAHYQLRLPADVPAKDFWSIVVYDPQTRSELQSPQPFPSKNSVRDRLTTSVDGSLTLHFGPTAPGGDLDHNWIQTVPGKGFVPVLRLYGPLEPWFDKTWRPSDLQLIA